MTELVRQALREPLKVTESAHPGLLLQRGWTDFTRTDSDNAGAGGKTEHIARICKIPAPDVYIRAFQRWLAATGDSKRFARCAMRVDVRLFIGLSGGGALETGCALSQTFGMPYLPGSSIKGIVRAWVEKALPGEPDIKRQIFGCEPTEQDKAGLSGLIAFHDAWWIPPAKSEQRKYLPFVPEIVTPHHPDYYGKQGQVPATDLDRPVPNAMIAVRGSFLFSIEGEVVWTGLTLSMLKEALADHGIGAKTAAGYGYLAPDDETLNAWAARMAAKSGEQNFARATLSLNPGSGAVHATLSGSRRITAPVKGTAAIDLLAKLPEEERKGKKIKEGKLLVEVTVKEEGNLLTILDLRPIPF